METRIILAREEDEDWECVEEENHDWNVITENVEAKATWRCVDVKEKTCEKPSIICKKTNKACREKKKKKKHSFEQHESERERERRSFSSD